MLGLARDADGLDDGTCPEPGALRVDAVAAWYAPSYLGSLGSSDVAADVEAFAGGKLAAASPSHYVSADDPPVLLAHGTHDSWVPVTQSRALAALLGNHHVDHAYVEVPGALHGFYPLGGDASDATDNPGPDPADYYQSHPGVAKELRRAQCALVGFLDARLHP